MPTSQIAALPPDEATLEQRDILCSWLRKLRGEESRKAVAARAGMSPDAYRRIEKGFTNRITPRVVRKLAKGLRVSASEVMKRVDEAGY